METSSDAEFRGAESERQETMKRKLKIIWITVLLFSLIISAACFVALVTRNYADQKPDRYFAALYCMGTGTFLLASISLLEAG